MNMRYPIIIHKQLNSGYGVIVPDLPGCFSAGSTIDEAIQNSHEAIECHLEGLLKDGEPHPSKTSVEHHLENPELSGGVIAIVEIDTSSIWKKINSD